MSSNKHSWVHWILPFLIGGGMAFGGLIGMSNDPALFEGDNSGAAGALLVVICLVMGFSMATFTIIVAKVLRRSSHSYIALRIGLSILGGGILGVLGSNDGEVATTAAWFLLIVLPVFLAWPFHANTALNAASNTEDD